MRCIYKYPKLVNVLYVGTAETETKTIFPSCTYDANSDNKNNQIVANIKGCNSTKAHRRHLKTSSSRRWASNAHFHTIKRRETINS
jgi:hypothetical protein